MTSFDRDPVPVSSQKLHGPSFGFGTLGLVGLVSMGVGILLGGFVMPLLRSDPPDQSQIEKAEAAQSASRALLFSMYPQTIYASLVEGGPLVSTGMSVEQYLSEVEVRASQSGYTASKTVERAGEKVEVSFRFAPTQSDTTRTFPSTNAALDHPKTLVLVFNTGPLPATVGLGQARVDGRAQSRGAAFVDMVSLGATPPPLAEGQFLTRRGLFEIKLTGDGVGAFLDNQLVYPARTPNPAQLPRRMSLQSFQPAMGVLKDRLILVASESADQACGAKAIIIDAQRGTVLELPEMLQAPNVGVSNAKDALILAGFCVPTSPAADPKTGTSGDGPTSEPAAEPSGEIRLSARYDLKTGALTWQREIVPLVAEIPVVAGVSAGSVPWREVNGTRLASPLLPGGGLISVACKPAGGVTIALSGLPAPADGAASAVRFSAGGGSALAQMRWRASASGYELDGASRPNEARAILERLRGGGSVTVSAAGGTKTIATPMRAQIDRLIARCGAAAPVRPPSASPTKPKVQTPPKAAPKPNPTRTAAPAVVPKPAPKPAPAPAPKPKPSPEISSEPKANAQP